MCKKKYKPKQYNPNSKSNLFVLHIVKPLLPEHPNVHMLTISTQSRCPAIHHLEDSQLLSCSLYKVSDVGTLANHLIHCLFTNTSISDCLHLALGLSCCSS